jgi:DNA-directed RNA polymerase III subunit RPC1
MLSVVVQIASVIEESWTSNAAYIEIHIDADAVQRLQLEVTLSSIKQSLVLAPKLRIPDGVRSFYICSASRVADVGCRASTS